MAIVDNVDIFPAPYTVYSIADGTKTFDSTQVNDLSEYGFEYKGAYEADGHTFYVYEQTGGDQAVIRSDTAPADSTGWPAIYNDLPDLDSSLPAPELPQTAE